MAICKDPVRLRMRTTSTGLKSLYLDIYVKGRRSYEYLRLYLLPELTPADRQKNKDTMILAEAIRAKRLLEVRNETYDFLQQMRAVSLFAFINKMGRGNGYHQLEHHLRAYARRDITLAEVTPKWAEGFTQYLDTYRQTNSEPLREGTKHRYMCLFRAVINEAIRKGYLRDNPMKAVKIYHKSDPVRVYLTLDEVRMLDAAPCKSPILKRAFLFSCFTGLRKSDISALKWGQVEQLGDFTRIVFRQQKTQGLEYLDIAPQAVKYMGERKGANALIFEGFQMRHQHYYYMLREWVLKAGINKHINFHTGRHTFAVVMLDLGTDIYTLSKLLGHRDIKTTQIYAELLDKKKQNAVSMLPIF